METVERHIKNQFEIAQRREHLSWDVKVGTGFDSEIKHQGNGTFLEQSEK